MEHNKPKILVVDDDIKNSKLLLEILALQNYEVFLGGSGKECFDILESVSGIDLILLDVMMPDMDGYEVCRRIKTDALLKDIPIIFLTSLDDNESQLRGFDSGAVDFITKPFQRKILGARVKTQIELRQSKEKLNKTNAKLEKFNCKLEDIVKSRTRELTLTQEVTIECMASLAESRDAETGMHIKRTKYYVKELALYLKGKPKYKDFLDNRTIDMLYQSAPLHDIGKIAIPDSILHKPGKLTNEEFSVMKMHTLYGSKAIAESEEKLTKMSFLRYAKEMAATHHEKWDGTGYPLGLKADQIPISGRIMALADVYDALVPKRIYKDAISHEKAIEIIKEGRGTHFDPDIVDAFLAIESKFREIASLFSDN